MMRAVTSEPQMKRMIALRRRYHDGQIVHWVLLVNIDRFLLKATNKLVVHPCHGTIAAHDH